MSLYTLQSLRTLTRSSKYLKAMCHKTIKCLVTEDSLIKYLAITKTKPSIKYHILLTFHLDLVNDVHILKGTDYICNIHPYMDLNL